MKKATAFALLLAMLSMMLWLQKRSVWLIIVVMLTKKKSASMQRHILSHGKIRKVSLHWKNSFRIPLIIS